MACVGYPNTRSGVDIGYPNTVMPGMHPPDVKVNSSQPDRFGLYVGNVDSSITLEVLKETFSQYGKVIDAALAGRDTDPFRFGFIDFATAEDRDRALNVNGYQLQGRALKVGLSKGGGAAAQRRPERDNRAPPGQGLGGTRGNLNRANFYGAPPGPNHQPTEEQIKLKELQKRQYFEQAHIVITEFKK